MWGVCGLAHKYKAANSAIAGTSPHPKKAENTGKIFIGPNWLPKNMALIKAIEPIHCLLFRREWAQSTASSWVWPNS